MSESTNTTNKIEELLTKISEQEWFIQLKNKWNDLDSQKQISIQIVSIILLMSFFIGFTFYGAYQLQSTQKSFAEKTELLTYLKNIQSEIQTINQYTRDIQLETDTPQWEQLIKTTLTSQGGLADEQIEIKKQKDANFSPELKEYLYAVQIKNSHLKPLKAIHAFESQMKPLKVRKINIQSKGNKEPVDAQLFISAFALANNTPPTGK